MTRAAVLVLLGAALLLASSGNCNICPALEKYVNLFVAGTVDEYMAEVEKYQKDSVILDSDRKLKVCTDHKLTDEDRKHALNVLKKIYSSPLC